MGKLSKLIQKFLASPPEVRFEEVRTLLEGLGFHEARSKGSHHIFRDESGRQLTIPKTGGQKVKRTYIQKIVELLNLEDWKDDSN
ncbi:type II toxin-antitoxin system HicA family toxin [Pseudanabaena galeata UHCC 0370]|uniref:Type II toxin-antitoxin system HicA family toxin n=1 Tax=Pseudanabaena galeata UHCC 0370 TaxID=3110310 RepID=A0ABU5TDS7_9CYAN|nr:type II toxin-antitoxin system HicA family toxin [Pseudanabaena galeata]MEA5476423.1 type II toxin-antitoxin system HicA family toxin [Pseudanabaena galeata UHCC 0370]